MVSNILFKINLNNIIYIILVMDLNKELIKLLNQAINIKYHYDTNKYKRVYTNEYYLINIFEMLNDINKWETLQKLKTYNPVLYKGNITKYHYKSIQYKFNKWCKDGIFKDVFNNFINKHLINKEIKLFIDSTFINNKYGIEDIGLNIDNKKKKASKLSIICDASKFIYSITSIKIKKNNNKKSIGFIHDSNTIQNSLNNINKIYNFKNVLLMGDKGYKTQNEFTCNNKKIRLLTSKRKNQKEQNNKNDCLLLKKRIYSENSISNMKKNERVMTRKDHTISSYMGFVYLSCIKNNIKIFNKLIQ